jgi:hypothetical protein
MLASAALAAWETYRKLVSPDQLLNQHRVM